MTQTMISLTNTQYRLGYHVSAPSGWINDPNGFCYFKGYYHIFYQYHPYSAKWGPMHWGHARSKDLIHWETLPVALTPGDTEDMDGCFSGSAIVKDDTLYLFYTGHHYYGDNDPDHFWQNQNMAYSTDGIHFQKYKQNPIIQKEPQDNTHHFRDPKVWEHNGMYYMILGSQAQDGLGRSILYSSFDLHSWSYLGVMSKARELHTEGFMWECPDFFHLNGKDILLLSPQGIEATETEFLNLFQTGYFVGDLNYQTGEFTHGDFYELDKGHDFYATQTMLAPDGRRLMFAWMNMWESDMPEQAHGWAGALSLPRELTLRDNHLCMTPVKEVKGLRSKKLEEATKIISDNLLLSKNHAFAELNLQTMDTTIAFNIKFKDQQGQDLLSLAFDPKNQIFTLHRCDLDSQRFGRVHIQDSLDIQCFIDKSSVEIFINQGELVFTERLYSDDNPDIIIQTKETMMIDYTLYQLQHEMITHS